MIFHDFAQNSLLEQGYDKLYVEYYQFCYMGGGPVTLMLKTLGIPMEDGLELPRLGGREGMGGVPQNKGFQWKIDKNCHDLVGYPPKRVCFTRNRPP